jgi:ubiquinone/menaquinone biosynthesis C-methylase UbiE
VARIDYTKGADAYRAARTVPPAVLAAWDVADERLALPRAERVLDLGAGPGGWLEPLARWFGAPVVAVEPSTAMRDEARAAGLADRHRYLAAPAEHLPLRPRSIDVAWLSTVIHQFDDRDAAARELRRVTRDGGRVLVRGFFADLPVTGLLACFPGIDRAAATFPSTEAITATFAAAGFELAHEEHVVEPWTFELEPWAERVRRLRHLDSALRPLTDEEIEAGVQAVRHDHERRPGPIASPGTLGLQVFAATG